MALEIEINSNSKQAQSDLKRLNESVNNISKSADRTGKALSTSFRVISAATTALIGGAGLKGISDGYTRIGNQIALVTGRTNALIATQSKLLAVSRRTNSGLEDTVKLYSSLVRNTKLSSDEALRFSETLNKAAKIGGGSIQTINGSIIQLQQGLAAGALRGEELNSVLEGLPRVAQAIAKELKVDIGQLRALAEQGRITAEVIERALSRSAKNIDAEFKEINTTIGLALSNASRDIGKGLSDIFRVLDTGSLGGVINELGVSLGKLLEDIAVNLRVIQTEFLLFRLGTELTFSKVEDAVTKPFKRMVTGVRQAATQIDAGLKPLLEFANTVKDLFFDLYIYVTGASVFPDMIDGIIDNAERISEAAKTLEEFTEDITEYFSEMYGKVLDFFEDVENSYDSLLSKIRSLPDAIRLEYGPQLARAFEQFVGSAADTIADILGTSLIFLASGAFLLKIGNRIAQGFVLALGGALKGFAVNFDSKSDNSSLVEELKKQTILLVTISKGIGEVLNQLSGGLIPTDFGRSLGAFLKDNLLGILTTVFFSKQLFRGVFSSARDLFFSKPGEGISGRFIASGIRSSTNFASLRKELTTLESKFQGLNEQIPAQRGILNRTVGFSNISRERATLDSMKERRDQLEKSIFRLRNKMDSTGVVFSKANKAVGEATFAIRKGFANLFGGVGGILGSFLGASIAQELLPASVSSAEAFVAIVFGAKVGEIFGSSFIGLLTNTLPNILAWIARKSGAVFVAKWTAGVIASAFRAASIWVSVTTTQMIGTALRAAAAWVAGISSPMILVGLAVAGIIAAAFSSDTLNQFGKDLGVWIYEAFTAVSIWSEAAASFGKYFLDVVKDSSFYKFLEDLFNKDSNPTQSGSRRRARRATGGSIYGAGTGTSDSIPAMLSNGEFVVRASVAEKHRSLLERLNSTGKLPGFRDGGMVTQNSPIWKQIMKEEGFEAKAYLDSKGYPTIGYGTLLEKKVMSKSDLANSKYAKLNWTKSQAAKKALDYINNTAVPDAINFIGANVWKDLPSTVMGMLVSTAYNLGGGKLGEFVGLRKAISAGDWTDTGYQLLNSKAASDAYGRYTPLAKKMFMLGKPGSREGLLSRYPTKAAKAWLSQHDERKKSGEGYVPIPGFADGGMVEGFNKDGSFLGHDIRDIEDIFFDKIRKDQREEATNNFQDWAKTRLLYSTRLETEVGRVQRAFESKGLNLDAVSTLKRNAYFDPLRYSEDWRAGTASLTPGWWKYSRIDIPEIGGYPNINLSLENDYKISTLKNRFATGLHELAHAKAFLNDVPPGIVNDRSEMLSFVIGRARKKDRLLFESLANIDAKEKLSKLGISSGEYLEDVSQLSYMEDHIRAVFRRGVFSTVDPDNPFSNYSFPNETALSALKAAGISDIQDFVEFALRNDLLGTDTFSARAEELRKQLRNFVVDDSEERARTVSRRLGYQALLHGKYMSGELDSFTKLFSYLGFDITKPLVERAMGGSIYGAGTATSDSIPAMLSNGEFVVRASVANKYRSVLERLNNTGNLPRFDTGGSAGIVGSDGFFSMETLYNIMNLFLEQLRGLVGEDIFGQIQNLIEAVKKLFPNFTGGSTKPSLITEGDLANRIIDILSKSDKNLSVSFDKLEQFLDKDSRATENLIRLTESLAKVQARIAELGEDAPLQLKAQAKSLKQDIVNALGGIVEVNKTISDNTRELSTFAKNQGAQAANDFEGDFQTGLSALLKGEIGFGDFGDQLLDQFTSRVLDSLSAGFTNGLFQGKDGGGGIGAIFEKLFGETAQLGVGAGSPIGGAIGQLGASPTNPVYTAPAFNDKFGFTPDEVTASLEDPMFDTEESAEKGAGFFQNVFKQFEGGFDGILSNFLGSFQGLFKGIGQLFSGGGFGGFSGGGGWLGAAMTIAGAFFHTGGIVPDNGGFMKANGGEMVLTPKQQQDLFMAAKGGHMADKQAQQFNINITGDISRQTKKEIYGMLPSIATGVNQYNRENSIG